jgi:hypothetical protein
LETEGLKIIFELIGQWGFPIFVATYSLLKLNSTIGDNTKAIISMQEMVKNMIESKEVK